MPGTFTGRIAELRHETGLGELLRGSVEVNQVYAHYQHERADLHHPRGGHAFYLSVPLFDKFHDYLAAVAATWTQDGGKRAMAGAMEDLSGEVEDQAPVEFGDLSRSGHPKVELGVHTVYDRPPKAGRLSEADLRAKSRLRYASLPDRLKGWIWWHVQHHSGPPPRHR